MKMAIRISQMQDIFSNVPYKYEIVKGGKHAGALMYKCVMKGKREERGKKHLQSDWNKTRL